MKEAMKCVSHEQASQLLHNKFVVVLGDSIQRGVYKDLVLLLQKDKYLSVSQLKTKGERSFEQDCLVEGGRMAQMNNGVEYREVRQFRTDHHLVRFYFLTRIYSRYMRSILDDFRQDLKPDVVIVNSCVWDISRYNHKWVEEYQENLHKFFVEMTQILPQDTLIMWNLTMPLGKKIIGGFLVPEIQHKAPQLRHDVIEANFYSGTLADAYGLDILDLHFQFRFSLQHRTGDGVHWNALAHRRITSLLLQHAAAAWGVILPCPLTAVEHIDPTEQRQQDYENYAKRAVAWGAVSDPGYSYPPPANYFSANNKGDTHEMYQPGSHQSREYNGYSEEFCEDAYLRLPQGYLSFDNRELKQQKGPAAHRPCPPQRDPPVDGVCYRPALPPAHHFLPNAPLSRCLLPPPAWAENQYVMRNRHAKRHYAPYTVQRRSHHSHHPY